MTAEELKYWKSIMDSSINSWVKDEIWWHNRKELFLYKGGESGIYISITKDGILTGGRYEGAFPHIGDAIFEQLFKKKFNSQEEAVNYVKGSDKISIPLQTFLIVYL